MREPFRAVADVWAVPKPSTTKFYKKDWTKSLFTCNVKVNPDEGESGLLEVRLTNRDNGKLIAIAPYDGQHGIICVADSANSYVLIIQNKNMEAWLGIAFRNPADSIDFSLAIQSFMRRRLFEDRLGSPGWTRRRAAHMKLKKDANQAALKSPSVDGSTETGVEKSGKWLPNRTSSDSQDEITTLNRSSDRRIPALHIVPPPVLSPPPFDLSSEPNTPESDSDCEPTPSPLKSPLTTQSISSFDDEYGEFQTA